MTMASTGEDGGGISGVDCTESRKNEKSTRRDSVPEVTGLPRTDPDQRNNSSPQDEGANATAEELTDDDFLEQTLSLGMQEAECQITEAYVRSITEKLSQENLLKGEEGLARDLEDTLRGLVTIECNAQVIDEDSCNLYYEVINNATKDYQGLVDMAFLLLNAPRRPGGHQTHSLELNQTARQMQLENFVTKYEKKFPDYSVESVTGIVKNYKDIQEHIISFFQCLGQRAKLAIIVYNGHGTPNGTLSLDEEPRVITNTQFLDDIQELWEIYKGIEYRQQHRPVSLPMKVKVILAQCYGHVHASNKERDRIQAVSLSSETKPITTSKIWWSCREVNSDTSVVDSVHEDLELYTGTRGNRSSELDIINRRLRHRQSADAMSIPHPGVMSPIPESTSSNAPTENNSVRTHGSSENMIPKSLLNVSEQQSSSVDQRDVNVEIEEDEATSQSREIRRKRTKYKTLPHIHFIRSQRQTVKRHSGYQRLDSRQDIRHSLPPTLTKVQGNLTLDYRPTPGRIQTETISPDIPQSAVTSPAVNAAPKPCAFEMLRRRQVDNPDGVPSCRHRYCQSYYNSVHESEQTSTPTTTETKFQEVPVADAQSPSSISADVRQESQAELILADDSDMSISSRCTFCCYKCRKSTR